GGAAKLRADYETLRQVNPRLVYCSISGYGQDGPYRDRVGHDVNYLGFAGVIDVTGTETGLPAIPGVQIADIGGGALMAATGILSALLAREHSGTGQFVDISMMDGAVAWQVVNVMNLLATGIEPRRGATMLTGRYPCYAVYETADGRHVTVGALEPHFWRNLCQQLEMPEFIEKQFAEGAEREAMMKRFREAFREKTMAEWLSQLADVDICFGPVASVSEMLDDPQVRHRQMVPEISDRRGERRRTLGNPIKLSVDGPTIRTPPPELGEHTDAVLTDLGYTPAQIVDLRTRGVV
ncbi:MAG TPA: CaiB/BaiF CoA-transferase family protein, partial [Candidatus Binatia bacterium]|nr:CaiB/BaiF CoA-transferase family protein [Candidatus Binatia bacterium]